MKYSQLLISRAMVSQSTILHQRIYFGHISYFFSFFFIFHFNSLYLKLLISQRKFSGTRKFPLRYQWFGMNFDFEISRTDHILLTFIEIFQIVKRVIEIKLVKILQELTKSEPKAYPKRQRERDQTIKLQVTS